MRSLWLLCLLALVGCAPVGTNLYSGRSEKTQSRTYQDSFDRVYSVAAQVAVDLGWVITNTDQSLGLINATIPALSQREADEVDVRVMSTAAGVQVRVKSLQANELNRQHIATYLDRVGFALGGA
jgi:hypothetical protein